MIHFLGEDLLPPCPEPWEHEGELLRMTPVLGDLTCPACVEFLEHV